MTPLRKTPLENIVGKGENAGNQHSFVEEVKEIRKGLSVDNTNHAIQPVLPTTDPAETDASPVEEALFLDGHTLGEMKRDSVSVGNFAARLVMHFFPDLFGITNRRFLYNWNGRPAEQTQTGSSKEKSHQNVRYKILSRDESRSDMAHGCYAENK